MNSWHVRCRCGLREIKNAGEASPYVDNLKKFERNIENTRSSIDDRGSERVKVPVPRAQ